MTCSHDLFATDFRDVGILERLLSDEHQDGLRDADQQCRGDQLQRTALARAMPSRRPGIKRRRKGTSGQLIGTACGLKGVTLDRSQPAQQRFTFRFLRSMDDV